MIHTSDITKDCILNKAVRDATNIILKRYKPVIMSESCQTEDTHESKYETIYHIKETCISHSQEFLLKMATIAWDFLNVLSMFQSNLQNQSIDENIPSTDI